MNGGPFGGLHSFYSHLVSTAVVQRRVGAECERRSPDTVAGVAEDDRSEKLDRRADRPCKSFGVGPRVSVVIPAYNGENYLAATLDSVRAQTFEGWELVVYDDGSRDATAALVSAYAALDRRIRLVSGKNGGVAAARNRGLEVTDPRSEFVIFLDHDDVWEPDALETLVGVLDGPSGYVSSHSLARSIGEDGLPTPGDDLADWMRNRKAVEGRRVVDVPRLQPTTFAAMAVKNWVVTPGTHLIRRAVAEAAGGFDARAVPADDWDLAIRVSRMGDIGYVDRPLVGWRRHPGAQSNVSDYGRAYFRVRRKMLSDPCNSPAQLGAARQSFVAVIRSTVRDVGQSPARQEVRAAVRDITKVGYQVVVFLSAECTVLLRPVINRRASVHARK
jgi:glycosyltransferase involved in cell wall biosynthesis